MKLHFKWCNFLKTKRYFDCECEKHRYWIIFFIALFILILEIIGGIVSGSLALLADSVHVAIDFSNIIISIIVIYLVKNHNFNEEKTRDYGAIVGMSLLSAGVILIGKEAVERLFEPVPTKGLLMLVISVIGAFGNYFMEFLLHNVPDEEKNITNKVFHLHVQMDLYLSYAIIISSVLIMLTGWQVLDPIASLIICLYISKNIWEWISKEEKCDHKH